MPKKSFVDGRAISAGEARQLTDAWEQEAPLLSLTTHAKRLMQDARGKTVVLPTLENMAYNQLVLLHVARSMSARHRLSADPIDLILVMFGTWYSKYQASYERARDFNLQQWAFKDAWVVHKIFTRLRQKVLRPEKPREPRIDFGSCQQICFCCAWFQKFDRVRCGL